MRVFVFISIFLFTAPHVFANQELITAVIEGNTAQIERLLRPGTEVDVNFSKLPHSGPLRTALHFAVDRGNLDIVNTLISHGAHIDKTALHRAVERGNLDIVNTLISHGAAIHLSYTALHLAVKKGSVNIVNFLLDTALRSNIALVNLADRFGYTALHYAAENQRLDVLNVLISRGAFIDLGDSAGEAALHFAARKGNLDIVNSLISHGADIHHMSAFGETALHYAAEYGHLEVLNSLLSYGARVDQVITLNGRTALHVAAANGHLEALNSLISHGATIDFTDQDEMSALQVAAYFGHLEVLNSLISHGADIDHLECSGNTAFQLADSNDRHEIKRAIQSILNRRIPLYSDTQFTIAIKTGNLPQIQTFLKSEGKVTLSDLELAKHCKYPKIVHYLTKILELRSYQYVARTIRPPAISLPLDPLEMIREYLFGNSSRHAEEHLKDLNELPFAALDEDMIQSVENE